MSGTRLDLLVQPFILLVNWGTDVNLKKPLTFSEQVEKLNEHGIIIKDAEKKAVEEYLGHVNYYKLTGYTLQFRKEAESSNFATPHTFSEIKKLYDFDADMRQMLRGYLEIVETYCKTQIANSFALEKCMTPPYDQHYDEANYFNKIGFQHIMQNFGKEQSYYADSLIVLHHMKKYAGKMPLWVMMELMSFSSVSKFYKAMFVSSQKRISKNFGVGFRTLGNHLHCLAVLRNKCSHAGRLMNVRYNPPAHLSRKFLNDHPSVSSSSLFAYLLVLKWRLPTSEHKSNFQEDLFAILEKYKDIVDLSLIGFPKNYKNLL